MIVNCSQIDVPLIGVCPQAEIQFPKLNPTSHPLN